MNKLQVQFKNNGDVFPYNGSPLSLTNVDKLIISDINIGESSIVMQLIGLDEEQHAENLINGYNIEINFPYPRKWDWLFFIADIIPTNTQASFTCELSPRV